MRAKIVYTVDVEEIPHEVERLRRKAEDLLERSLREISAADPHASLEKTIKSFENTSKELITIDLLLQDSRAILEGYLISKLDTKNLSSASPIHGDEDEEG